MANNVFNWFLNCLNWLPPTVLGMIVTCILIKFGDAVLGLWDRALRLIGR